MIDLSNYSCDKCAREFSRHCKHCWHTADKPPTKFKHKKKTGIQMPELRKYTPPPMPPVKPAKENAIDTSHLRIKTLEAIRIEMNKNHLTASVEVAEFQDAAKVQVSTNSSSREDRNYKGDPFNLESLSWRDAFAPGATTYLVGIFEDWVTGELIYGEYDALNYTFIEKENNKCKD